MPRRSPEIKLSDEDRAELERRAGSLTLPYRTVVRAKIVLLGAAGLTNAEIASRVDMSPDRVGDWRRRFREEGVEGLADKARSGRPRRFPPRAGRRGKGGGLRAARRGRPALAPLNG